jgi:hypothetical protein
VENTQHEHEFTSSDLVAGGSLFRPDGCRGGDDLDACGAGECVASQIDCNRASGASNFERDAGFAGASNHRAIIFGRRAARNRLLVWRGV